MAFMELALLLMCSRVVLQMIIVQAVCGKDVRVNSEHTLYSVYGAQSHLIHHACMDNTQKI